MPSCGMLCLFNAPFLWLSTSSTPYKLVIVTLSLVLRLGQVGTIRAICTVSVGFRAGRDDHCTLFIERSWSNCLGMRCRGTAGVGALGMDAASALGFLDDWRDCLLTATLTMGCCQVEDGADLDACDFWPDHDAQAGYVQYEGCSTLNIKKMKNDQHRKGCRKRFGRSRDPDLDVVDQLKAWIREVGLELRAG